MSGGNKCKCNHRKWEVLHYKHNHSAFEQPKYAEHYSEYSTIICKNCGSVWRTKAKYVDKLPKSPFYEDNNERYFK